MIDRIRAILAAALVSGLIVGGATGARAQVNMPVPGSIMGGGGMMGGGGTMPGGGGMMGMMGGSCADMLKSGLAITDVQKGPWEAYVSALNKTPSSLTGMKDSIMTAFTGGKSAIEQLDAQISAAESRLKALKELRPATASLYAALNADQKKKADQMLSSCIQ
jgi:hypothetical protein